MTVKELIHLLSQHQWPDNQVLFVMNGVDLDIASIALITGGVEFNLDSPFVISLVGVKEYEESLASIVS